MQEVKADAVTVDCRGLNVADKACGATRAAEVAAQTLLGNHHVDLFGWPGLASRHLL